MRHSLTCSGLALAMRCSWSFRPDAQHAVEEPGRWAVNNAIHAVFARTIDTGLEGCEIPADLAEPTREELEAERRRLEALIVPGVEAFAIMMSEPTKSGRRTFLGIARVHILEATEKAATVRVVKGSGVPIGHTYNVPLWNLYAVLSKERRIAFGKEVERLYGDRR